MRRSHLIARGLSYYWRTHLAVVAGVATAVAVLSGALLVGDSVRGSLRDLVLGRLGATDFVVASAGFFREALAEEMQRDPRFASSFSGMVPLIAARALVTHQADGRRAGEVAVYGVDDRFWRFHGVKVTGPHDREAFLSPALAAQIGAEVNGAILVRVQRPTDVPIESLHGRKDAVGQTLRLTVSGVLPPSSLGEFLLEPQQGDVRAVFVPLSRLQEEVESPGRVNMLLASASGERQRANDTLQQLVRDHATLDDLGLTLKISESRHTLVLGSAAGVLGNREAAAAQAAATSSGMTEQPILTYLANTLRIGNREVPYSLVTALDLRTVLGNAPNVPNDPNDTIYPIVLTTWPASELQAKVGDVVAMEYYAWEEPGRLVTRDATFRVAAVVPIGVGDRDFAPTFPGISDSPTLSDWDPPFPVDLRRIRPVDEQYWKMFRTTPKAYVPLEVGQRLWRTRYGELTSVRVTPPAGSPLDDTRQSYADRVRATLDPLSSGMLVRDVRDTSLAASKGATDFGEYFVYFSFFLVVSALLLAALFFKLGVEQRVREVGLLRAVGFRPAGIQRLFLGEGILLAMLGSLIGVVGALGYASLLMIGLRTWWVDAVGTTALTLHVTLRSLLAGAVSGVLSAVVCIWWTLRSLAGVTERSLLAGDTGEVAPVGAPRQRVMMVLTVVLGVAGLLLVTSGAAGLIDAAGAFFGAGFALLGASLGACLLVFRRRVRRPIDGSAARALPRLGFRNASYRPGRSVLSMAVIAAATFILISVDAFRRDARVTDADRHSGVGGYAVMVSTLLPIARDPNTPEGREALNLFDLDPSVRFEPFRVRPGDDASCLNLYEPRNPRIIAPQDAFLMQGRFDFGDSLASTPEERANPWLLLQRKQPDGVVPVIADANSMTYVLHRKLGEEIVIPHGASTLRLRLVGALRDSIFQGELLMSQSDFLRLFPEQQGYQLLLVEAPANRATAVAGRLEDGLSDLGADAVVASERLAEFHRVENTYLSTFQTLGGLGLLLGTVGLATVLLRNVLERRRELALLGAVGFRSSHVAAMILAENALLLAGGLSAGALCAALAIAPAIAERGGRVPASSRGLLLLFAVLATGLLSSVVALRAATRAPLLSSLRSE